MKLLTLCTIIAANLFTVESTDNTDNIGGVTARCYGSPMKLSIAVDVSTSITDEDLVNIRASLNDFGSRFRLDPDFETGVEIGVNGYFHQRMFYYNTHFVTSENQLIHQTSILLLYHHNHDANITIPIEYMIDKQFAPHRTRPGVAKVGIILTNQQTNSILSSSIAAKRAKKQDIILFAIGLSNLTCKNELSEIVGNESRALTVESVDQLNTILDDLASRVCFEIGQFYGPPVPLYKVCEQTPLEIGIVLDSSNSIYRVEFNSSLIFLKNLLSKFEISSEPNGVRVSVIPYADGNYRWNAFNLNSYDTTDKVVQAIKNIRFERGRRTYTGAAIKYMHTVQMAHNIVRPGVRKIGIVLTDGQSHDHNVVISASHAAREDNVIMFAIGVKKEVGMEELIIIAGNESRVYWVADFSKLRNIIDELANRTCQVEGQVEVEEEDTERCEIQNPADVIFVYSRYDLCTDASNAIDFVNTTIRSNGMQGDFRYGVMSGISYADDVGFSLTPEPEVQTNMTTFTGSRLPLIAKRLSPSSFEVEGDGHTRDYVRKMVVFISNSNEAINQLYDIISDILMYAQVYIAYLGPDQANVNEAIAGYVTIIQCDSTERLMANFSKILSKKFVREICPTNVF